MNPRRILLLVAIAAFLGPSRPAGAEGKKYDLNDLQALDQRQAWDELLAHLQDVKPSQRTAAWNRVVEHACVRPGQMDSGVANYCAEPLKSVLVDEPQNAAFAWKAGKWARVNLQSWAAEPFFAGAIRQKGDSRCKDEDVSLALIAALSLPADSNKEIVEQSKGLAFGTCWPAVKEPLLKALGDSPDYLLVANACGPLKQKGVKSAGCEAKP